MPGRWMRASAPDYAGCPATVGEAAAAGRMLVPLRWGLADAVVMVAGAVLLAAGTVSLLRALGAPFAAVALAGLTVPWLALAGWPLLATRTRGNGPVIDLGLRLTWRDAGRGVVGGIIALAVGSLVALVMTRMGIELSSAAGGVAAQLVEGSPRAAWLAFALCIAIGGPVVEEIAFRGLAYGALRKTGLGTGLTVLLSSLAFALMHAEPTRLPVLLAVGIVLGILRARTGAIGASIVAHGLNNLPGAVLLVLGLPGVAP